jgi:23S rRNA pseudoU1915 N3-methylase RlmH
MPLPLALLPVMSFAKTFWKPIAAIVIFAVLQFFVWNHGRNFGEERCTAKYEQQIRKRDEAINAKVTELNESSNKLAQNQKADTQKLRKDMQLILEQVREGKQPVVIVKDGKCMPTETFVETVNKINRRVNETP